MSKRTAAFAVALMGACALTVGACNKSDSDSTSAPGGGYAEYERSPSMAVATEAPADEAWRYQGPKDTESYDRIYENPWTAVADDPLSTFSIDVDTAAYSNVRRFLDYGQKPPEGAVRVEELINYFSYDYVPPTDAIPFTVRAEVGECPWNPEHALVHVGIKGKVIERDDVPARNLVFLIDVSGSMNTENKLPLLRRSLDMLADQLRAQDRVAMVVYAGSSGVVLDSTSGSQRGVIKSALSQLSAGGSTNGAAGIKLAYRIAGEHFIEDGINRVILATDGDFNVGVTSQSELQRLIEKKRETGVFLSVLGYGMGNYKDSTMEKLADHGDGNYAYIDNWREAKKVLIDEASGTLVTIAKDVKIQVEFNPTQVDSYRLIGYENRVLAHEDFNDDTKDAGEIGAGHTVTALYEVSINGDRDAEPGKIDDLKYQKDRPLADAAKTAELMNVKIRYKEPTGHDSKLSSFAIGTRVSTLAQTSNDFRFSAAVASFGLLLRGSKHAGSATFDHVHDLAKGAVGPDPNGYRAEFLGLVRTAGGLAVHR
jgi:Ca-activated chloride channel family protein